MKTFMKWTGLIVGLGVGVAFASKAMRAGRAQLKQAISHAESIADHTRSALEETEAALREAQAAI